MIFNIFKNFKHGILGTVCLTLILPLSFFLNFKIDLNFVNEILPLFFFNFLIIPYLNKESVIVGSFAGFILFSIISKLNLILGIIFGIIFSIIFLIYHFVFIKEPEKIVHTVTNLLSSFLIIVFSTLLLSIINAYLTNMYFLPLFQGYFVSGIISLIIVIVLSHFYGIKINSKLYILRK